MFTNCTSVYVNTYMTQCLTTPAKRMLYEVGRPGNVWAIAQYKSRADPESSVKWRRVLATFSPFLVINVFHVGPYEPPSRSNWTVGSNCFSRGSVPVFLRKSIATCDFPGVGVRTPYLPLDPPVDHSFCCARHQLVTSIALFASLLGIFMIIICHLLVL